MIPISTQTYYKPKTLWTWYWIWAYYGGQFSWFSMCTLGWETGQCFVSFKRASTQMADLRLSLGVRKAMVCDNNIRVYARVDLPHLWPTFYSLDLSNRGHFQATNVSVDITYYLTDIWMLVHPLGYDHWKHIVLFFHRTKTGPAQPQPMGRE